VHIASPDVHVAHAEQCIVMDVHGRDFGLPTGPVLNTGGRARGLLKEALAVPRGDE
tara:strand:+ start:1589 stop:1756 length:168 start_codon:yes stop_codon:yes gene_type:complete